MYNIYKEGRPNPRRMKNQKPKYPCSPTGGEGQQGIIFLTREVRKWGEGMTLPQNYTTKKSKNRKTFPTATHIPPISGPGSGGSGGSL